MRNTAILGVVFNVRVSGTCLCLELMITLLASFNLGKNVLDLTMQRQERWAVWETVAFTALLLHDFFFPTPKHPNIGRGLGRESGTLLFGTSKLIRFNNRRSKKFTSKRRNERDQSRVCFILELGFKNVFYPTARQSIDRARPGRGLVNVVGEWFERSNDAQNQERSKYIW